MTVNRARTFGRAFGFAFEPAFGLALALALALVAPLAPVPAFARDGVARPTQPAQLATYLGAGCTGRDRVAGFEQWLGRKVDRMVDFLSPDSWTALEATAMWVGECWRARAGRVVLSVPLLPRDGRSTLAEVAEGRHDAAIATVATRLVERGHGAALIRLGWEFNAAWFPWSATAEPAHYVAAWRRFVTVMRGVPGASFRFDWCPILGVGVASPEPAYPGDDVVDVIGADVYNVNYFAAGTTSAARRFELLRTAPFGIEWHRRFAQAHGKPMSYPEWGTGTRPDGHGGGDDAVFMAGMVRWIGAAPVEYQGYWNYPAPDFAGTLSDGSQPASAAVYRAAFGVRR